MASEKNKGRFRSGPAQTGQGGVGKSDSATAQQDQSEKTVQPGMTHQTGIADQAGKSAKSGKAPQPRLDVPKKPTDRAIELVGYGALLMLFGIPAIFYYSLPESIPVHYGFDGVPGRYGPRNMIWLLPGIGIVLYAGMMWLVNYPHLFNYPVRLTTKNIYRQYRYAQRVLRMITTLAVVMFAFLNYMGILIAFDQIDAIPTWPLLLLLAAIFGSVGAYTYKALKSD
jgi:uncharacterized membrane protein